ncbi:MAG: hypothetical protein JWP44_4176 [Mucilaginibacter sp.]|nr:hypothetical protein [Mucilaginibacter sp.]
MSHAAEVAQPTALLDASIVYGASRWIRGVHGDPTWPYHSTYRASDDKALFLDFLHHILLYDRLLVNNSSVATIGLPALREIQYLFDFINDRLGRAFAVYEDVGLDLASWQIAEPICRLIRRAIEDEVTTVDDLLEVNIPWAYSSAAHTDFYDFQVAAAEQGLDDRLLPFSIFAYRGLCYTALARQRTSLDAPIAYVAAPLRINALQRLLDRDVIFDAFLRERLYDDVFDELGLPTDGYDFSFMGVAQSEFSHVNRALNHADPNAALMSILELRERDEARAMRHRWSLRLSAGTASSIVGSTQIVTGSTIYGNVTMVGSERTSNSFPSNFPSWGSKMGDSVDKSDQIVEKNRVGGNTNIRSDAADARMVVRDNEIEGDLELRRSRALSSMELGELARQLQVLLKAAPATAKPGQFGDIDLIAKAEESARAGDAGATAKWLGKTAAWVSSLAKELSVDLVVKALTASAGLG